MENEKVYTAIGLMSGTSLDGVDAALIETDGRRYVKQLGFLTIPYDKEMRENLRACFGRTDTDAPDIKNASRLLTRAHINAVQNLLQKTDWRAEEVSVLGFHGQTILHDVARKQTIQIGDAAMLAGETGIDTIYDFRTDDLHAGGQGAPLAPMYHRARTETEDIERPVVIMNIGGVANITYIGETEKNIMAFDTGPGNALMDDYMKSRTGRSFDENGATAAHGNADQAILERWMNHPYFGQKPPKSLDRNEWDIADMGPMARDLDHLSLEDAMATLMAFTVRGIAASFKHLPRTPRHCYVAGGGRRNETMMVALQFALDCPVAPVEHLHWDGDATEAECFGYLAVRSLLGLPISLPGTTGCPQPMTGGKLVKTNRPPIAKAAL